VLVLAQGSNKLEKSKGVTMNMQPILIFLTRVISAAALAALAACDGGGDNPQTQTAAPVTQMISAAAGGTINGPNGVTLSIPPGALPADTEITIAIDSEGAPPLPTLPDGATTAGPMLSLTPHGTTFSVPVTVMLPIDPAQVPAGETPIVLKTNKDRDGWEQIDVTRTGDTLTAAITSFSNFSTIVPFRRYSGDEPALFLSIIGQPRNSPSGPNPRIAAYEGGFWIFRVEPMWAFGVIRCTYPDNTGLSPEQLQYYYGPQLSYQWSVNGFAKGGETSKEIMINPVDINDNGDVYTVRVTLTATNCRNAYGVEIPPLTVTSESAVLTVIASPPVIVNEPVDAQVLAGNNASFVAASTSTIVQTLQWERLEPIANNFSPIGGANGTTYTVVNADVNQSGTLYRLCATNSAGTTCSRGAQLTVIPLPVQPVIVTPPAPQAVAAGSSASFTVIATGGGLNYAWDESRDGVSFTEIAGATSATYTISNTLLGDDGLLLRVRVSNTVGNVTSDPPVLLTVRPLPSVALTRVVGGLRHSIGLRGDGILQGWGYRDSGLLGDVSQLPPGDAVDVPLVNDIATLSVSTSHNLAVQGNGEVWAWGDNSRGQLGSVVGPTSSNFTTKVSNIGPTQAVAAGYGYSLAVTTDGLLWGWGDNFFGQLGDGTVNTRPSPQPVARISGVVRVAAGDNHSLALRSDGSVWSWGSNYYGELGDGTTGAALRPIPIPTLTNIVAIAAGNGFSAALAGDDGSVLTWGRNNFGQLGDGATEDRYTPTRVNLPLPAIGIAAGGSHTLALLLDGSVYAWGNNSAGECGCGLLADRILTPQRVVAPLPGNIVAIGAGAAHSLAMDADGNVWAWGLNSDMQLNDGTIQNRYTPVQVRNVNLN